MAIREPLAVATAADDAYAMPLAVMGRSLLANLSPDSRIRLFVLDGGLAERSRRRILDSWDDARLEVEWIAPDVRQLRGVKVSGHVRLATYFRLLLGELLPADVARVLYLDADVIVEADLSPLWDHDLGGCVLAAAQDWIVRSVSAPNGIEAWRELGLAAGQKYFNAGVLVVDLARWRREGIGRRALEFLQGRRDRVRWWDQEGLNVVLAARWSELDPRWNLTIQSRRLPAPEEAPCDRQRYEAVVTRPFICHFTTHVKPWHTDCEHPRRDAFFRYLDQTSWAGWRPRTPSPPLHPEGFRHRVARIASRLRDAAIGR